ncbi:MAG: protein phosphatase 2C domain-containing protein [Pseudomonadota bacterium]
MTIHCDYFGATHQGQKRSVNQDRILVRQSPGDGPALLVVADGMGGEAAGDRAAELVVESIADALGEGLKPSHYFDQLDAMVEAAQATVQEAVQNDPKLSSMGTTLTMACCDWPRLYVVHVGDSRCYRLSGGELTRLTVDHTVAQRFVDEGVMSEDEAEKSPMAHQLWNVITSNREIRPERVEVRLSKGDAIMLCSDGLTKHVDDQEISPTITAAQEAKGACRELIKMANSGGGSDNISVIVGLFRPA